MSLRSQYNEALKEAEDAKAKAEAIDKEITLKAKHLAESGALDWKPTKDMVPSEGRVVMTKVDDENGCRNVQTLKRRGNLWYTPNDSMYVYYRPTHWAELGDI